MHGKFNSLCRQLLFFGYNVLISRAISFTIRFCFAVICPWSHRVRVDRSTKDLCRKSIVIAEAELFYSWDAFLDIKSIKAIDCECCTSVSRSSYLYCLCQVTTPATNCHSIYKVWKFCGHRWQGRRRTLFSSFVKFRIIWTTNSQQFPSLGSCVNATGCGRCFLSNITLSMFHFTVSVFRLSLLFET